MPRFTTSHRRHGDAFPLPTSVAAGVEKSRSSVLYRRRSTLQIRVAETSGILNELESSVAVGRLPPVAPSTLPPTPAQRSVIQHVIDTIAHFGDDDTGVSDQSALCDLLKSRDYYSVEQSHARVPFRRGKLTFLQKQFRPLALLPRPTGEALRLRTGFKHYIERSKVELERLSESGDLLHVRPYWDPILQNCREARISFLRELASI